MIELNSKTRQDFLDREWVQKLLDAGVDMSDAKYCIGRTFRGDYIAYKAGAYNETLQDIIPTYTVSELLYKLHEWICPIINGKEFSGGLTFIKDAPFYMFYYNLHSADYNPRKLSNEQPEEWNQSMMGRSEYPIESLASLLIKCHKRDIGFPNRDVGDISDK